MKDMKMKLFKAKVQIAGEVQEVPIWAESIDTALEVADLEYGEDNVLRLRPEVTQ
ncbi:putative host RNA polymerase [Pseudomonas phage MR1]|uniref:Putative host RNA polymerase n=1 Tax=Pseudomonas phage MR1 TaxID=2711169 RepID=A0A6M3T8I0_9CAUD|nr:putative host RNA polymerase [Pseudomonas phage MR1]